METYGTERKEKVRVHCSPALSARYLHLLQAAARKCLCGPSQRRYGSAIVISETHRIEPYQKQCE